jgi:homoserine kinase type II
MTKSNVQEVAVIPNILSYFSLGTPREIVPIKEGISNDSYLVSSNEHEYIVKFLINQTSERIENDVAIQQQLQRGNIHSPTYLQDKAGNYVYKDGDIKAVISPKIEGVTPRIANPLLAHDFGRVLASFHQYVTEIPHSNDKGLLNPEVSGVQSDIFSQPLPKGIVHGDFHLGNALVFPRNSDSIVAMLDFEEAGENLYVVDLALTVMSVCCSNENTFEPALVEAAIRGYQSIRKLTWDEKSMFALAIEYAAQTWIKWFTAHGYQRYAQKHQDRLHSFKKSDFSRL